MLAVAERPADDQAPVAQRAGHRMHHADLERFRNHVATGTKFSSYIIPSASAGSSGGSMPDNRAAGRDEHIRCGRISY